jgi:ubiquinone/menaquinone biosynthesis C-methylase UbiE
MIRSESRLTIAGNSQEVWAYLCDVGRWPEWAPTVRKGWVAGGGPLRPGARVEQRAKLPFGSNHYRVQTVTAVEAPRRLAFAGTMGTSAARWGMEFAALDDRQTEAMMWVEVDPEGPMCAIPRRLLKSRIRRVMDVEMAAIKAAVESAPSSDPDTTVSQIDSTHEGLIATYRKKARHYNFTSRLYPVPGYPQQAQRRRSVRALRLRPGDTVVDVACGTGQNFPLIEQAIGPEGRIIGVDLTDAMLAQAQHRIESNGWSNVRLVQADAAEFDFPTAVDAILSTYALSHVPECAVVIAHGAEALSPGGRWVVLDLKAPDSAPRWLAQLGIAVARRFGSIDAWIARRPWDALRTAMQDELADLSWTDLCFGTAFLAAGSRRSMTGDGPSGSGNA